MDTFVIGNPASGRGRGAKKRRFLDERIYSIGDVELASTNGPGHARLLAERALREGASWVIAAGGDGTVSEVASALVNTEATLGILPLGTGNDLARTLGVGPSMKKAFAAFYSGEDMLMDVGRWKADGRTGTFVNVAGMGFDAAVAERINKGFNSLRGTSAYLAAVVATLRTFRPQPIRLTVDDAVIEEDVMLIAVANAQTYGGGMKIAPMARVNDGVLDVILVRSLSKAAFLTAFPRVFKGSHLGHPAVDHYRARKIVLEPAQPSPFLIDGELVAVNKVEIDVEPKALRVRVPKNPTLS